MASDPSDTTAAFQALIAEGERLVALRPGCYKTRNDLGAVMIIAKMHAEGFAVTFATAEACIERMRIAVKTGQYPEHLLRQAEPPTGRLEPPG